MMPAVDIIRKKRNGEELSREEIDWMVGGIASGDVADYQWSRCSKNIDKKENN